MKAVELVVDTDVASFIFRSCERGAAYSKLIGESRAGVTLQAVAEFRAGVVQGNWGPRKIASLDTFPNRLRTSKKAALDPRSTLRRPRS